MRHRILVIGPPSSKSLFTGSINLNGGSDAQMGDRGDLFHSTGSLKSCVMLSCRASVHPLASVMNSKIAVSLLVLTVIFLLLPSGDRVDVEILRGI